MCKPHETAKWGHAKYTCVHGQLQAEVLCYDAFPVLLITSAWCCMLCPLSHWQDWDLSSEVWHPDPWVSPKCFCDAQWIGSDLVCLTPAFTEWQRTPITSSVLGMEFMRLENKKIKKCYLSDLLNSGKRHLYISCLFHRWEEKRHSNAAVNENISTALFA